ncbi:M16 family metallopeptidase [Tessaracoccus caeni]|uniref:M16 family metallopeptidase n=1 Tax=Tessaracoccus caeni TaxID=3031239 RepID=UPI0023DB7577|nr:pitrilysin family protein [Tessaracoccus caeni]MDF1486783.1 pitrilysin family protein [Tessaracoccus caeni]
MPLEPPVEELHYELTRARLSNGLEVVVQHDPGAPGEAVNLYYEVGSADEEPHRTGFAHLFEHLMFQGSAQVASGEHMALIEALGGTVNATTSSDRTNYFQAVPPGALDLVLWLEADRLASLAITADNFEAQRDVVKEERRQRYDNQPYGDLLELLIAQHFPAGHPYGHLPIGSMEHLDDAALDDVATFFARWYRPSNARLVLCGPVPPDEALDLVENRFGLLPTLPAPARPAVGERHQLFAPQVTSVTRPVPHSLSYLSWTVPPATHPDHAPLDLAASVLADGHASRLHRALVKEAGIATELHLSTLPHLRAESVVAASARPSEQTSVAELSERLLTEIAAFAESGPTEEELQRAQAQYERDWLWELATTAGRADLINEHWLTYGDPASINTHLTHVMSLTPADLARVVADHLTPAAAHQLHYLSGEDR